MLRDTVRAVSRVWTRYSDNRAGVLAAGIAHYAVFSLIPLLVVGFTVLGAVVGHDHRSQVQIADWVNRGLGETLVGTTPGEGVASVEDLTRAELLTLTGSVGLLSMLLVALGWVAATRQAIRAVFGLSGPAGRGNPVTNRMRDLGTSIAVCAAVLSSGGVGIAVPTATDSLIDAVGLERGAWSILAVRTLTFAVVWGIDSWIVLLLWRVLAGVDLPTEDLLPGAVAAGLGLGVFKMGGGLLLGGLSSTDTAVAASCVLVGVLLWADLTARLILLCTAWSAVTADDRGHLSAPDRGTTSPPVENVPGARAQDRTTLAAGIVLGSVAVAGTWVVTRAAGQLRSVLRD